MGTELVTVLIGTVLPLAIKEYDNLSQKGEFTDAQLATMKGQIQSYRDFVANPQWQPDATA
jgi:hypothetical protein